MEVAARLLDELAGMPPERQRAAVARFAKRHEISLEDAMRLIRRSWAWIARRKQLPPDGDWTFWFLMSGRGFGKTRSAAEWAAREGMRQKLRIGVIAPTLPDARLTCFEGVSGLLSVLPPEALYGGSRETAWNRGEVILRLANDTEIRGFSSERPDRVRGPEFDRVWGEEVSSWKDAGKGDELETTWSNVKLAMRGDQGGEPRAVLTSTPKANKLTKHLVSLAGSSLVLVRGSSYENRDNLPETWWETVVAPLEGTRTGRQEIMAEVLEDVEGALWTMAALDDCRVAMDPGWQKVPELRGAMAAKMRRIVVAVDPNTTSGESADNAGVVVCGIGGVTDGQIVADHGYVLDDRSIVKGGPQAWAAAAVDAYHDWDADRIVAETNNGGEMVELTIRGYDRTVPYRSVTASRGKRTRAEPVSALYYADPDHEKVATVHHLGVFAELEEELTTWTPADESPGRLDAMVWGMTDLKIWKPPGAGTTGVARGDIPGIVPIGAGIGDYGV